MPRIERSAILGRLRTLMAERKPIVGGGAGTGLSAKCEAAGGIDLIVIYNSADSAASSRSATISATASNSPPANTAATSPATHPRRRETTPIRFHDAAIFVTPS